MDYSRSNIYKPYFIIKFKGKSISEELKRLVTEVSIEDSDYEADTAIISVMDKNFKFTNAVKMLEKQSAEVGIGYKDKVLVKVKGTIEIIEADFAEDSTHNLQVTIVDKTTQFDNKKKTRTWKNKKASDIVKQIAKEYKFKYEVPTTSTKYEEYSQDDETDAELLSKLADDEGLVYYLVQKENKLYFGEAIRSPKAVGTLYYNNKSADIIAFQPSLVTKDSPNLVDMTAGEVSSKSAKSYNVTIKAKVDNSSKQSTTQKSGKPTVNGRR